MIMQLQNIGALQPPTHWDSHWLAQVVSSQPFCALIAGQVDDSMHLVQLGLLLVASFA
jgi:hypothetical protein